MCHCAISIVYRRDKKPLSDRFVIKSTVVRWPYWLILPIRSKLHGQDSGRWEAKRMKMGENFSGAPISQQTSNAASHTCLKGPPEEI